MDNRRFTRIKINNLQNSFSQIREHSFHPCYPCSILKPTRDSVDWHRFQFYRKSDQKFIDKKENENYNK